MFARRGIGAWLRPVAAAARLSRDRVAALQPAHALRRSMSTATGGAEPAGKTAIRGPVSWASFLLTLATGGGLVYYFREERKKIEARGPVTETKSFGKPKLGGPFELVDDTGKTVTDKDFFGRFIMVYFGFTHCPDACPEELSKMAEITDSIRKMKDIKYPITPVFISVDPKRDGVAEIHTYVKEFHKDMVGLTGTVRQIEQAARAYRVYFAPLATGDDDDYLVDHSIFFYLMDPQGKFVDCYGHNNEAENSTTSIARHMRNWVPQEEPSPAPSPAAAATAAPAAKA